MAGPTPMALGPYQFEAMGFGFSDVSRHLETPWAEVEVCARMEALHWVGPKSETVTIKGVLFPAEFGGQASLDGLRAAARSGRILTLATMDGTVGGRYAIQAIEEEMSHITGAGTPRRNGYSIKLKLYGGGIGGLAASVMSALGGIF